MKQTVGILIAAGLLAAGLAACKEKAPKAPEGGQQAAAPGATQPLPAVPAAVPGGSALRGKVVETMDAGPYTYVLVDTGAEKVWAAAPKFPIAVGDRVTVPEGIPMENYKSTTLDREFDLVYFVGAIGKGDEMPAIPEAPAPGAEAGGAAGLGPGVTLPEGMHPKVDATQAAKDAGVSFAGIKKAGKTVAEVFDGRSGIAGKEVSVRGRVVKFNPQVMGKNWIHLQDGTGGAGTNDLTITTDTVAKVGDTVLVKGKVTLDKDFGFGYRYDLIMEDAKVTVE